MEHGLDIPLVQSPFCFGSFGDLPYRELGGFASPCDGLPIPPGCAAGERALAERRSGEVCGLGAGVVMHSSGRLVRLFEWLKKPR